MAAKFDDFINAVLEGAKDLARSRWGRPSELSRQRLREQGRSRSESWVKLLADEKITKDFRDLVEAKGTCGNSRFDRRGIAATLERFRSGLRLVVNSAIKTFRCLLRTPPPPHFSA
jgi:hypothetical protein